MTYKELKLDLDQSEVFSKPTDPDDYYYLDDEEVYEAGYAGIEVDSTFLLKLTDGTQAAVMRKDSDGDFYINPYVEPKSPVEELVEQFNGLNTSDQLEFALKILKACKESTIVGMFGKNSSIKS